jgi:hypothetical protein
MHKTRAHLDQLFAIDAVCSVIFGVTALLAPHGLWQGLPGLVGTYNHSVHETLRYVIIHNTVCYSVLRCITVRNHCRALKCGV